MTINEPLPDLPSAEEAQGALREAKEEARAVRVLHKRTQEMADIFAEALVGSMERKVT